MCDVRSLEIDNLTSSTNCGGIMRSLSFGKDPPCLLRFSRYTLEVRMFMFIGKFVPLKKTSSFLIASPEIVGRLATLSPLAPISK